MFLPRGGGTGFSAPPPKSCAQKPTPGASGGRMAGGLHCSPAGRGGGTMPNPKGAGAAAGRGTPHPGRGTCPMPNPKGATGAAWGLRFCHQGRGAGAMPNPRGGTGAPWGPGPGCGGGGWLKMKGFCAAAATGAGAGPGSAGASSGVGGLASRTASGNCEASSRNQGGSLAVHDGICTSCIQTLRKKMQNDIHTVSKPVEIHLLHNSGFCWVVLRSS